MSTSVERINELQQEYLAGEQQAIKQQYMLMGARQAMERLLEEEEQNGTTETTDVSDSTPDARD